MSDRQHNTVKDYHLRQICVAATSWMTVAAIISTVTRKITAKNFISTNKQRRNDGLITCLQAKYCYIPGGPEKAVPRF